MDSSIFVAGYGRRDIASRATNGGFAGKGGWLKNFDYVTGNGMPMILAQIRDHLNLFPPVMLHTGYNRDRLDNPSIRVA